MQLLSHFDFLLGLAQFALHELDLLQRLVPFRCNLADALLELNEVLLGDRLNALLLDERVEHLLPPALAYGLVARVVGRLQFAEYLLLERLHEVLKRVNLHRLHLQRVLEVLFLVELLRLVLEVKISHRLGPPGLRRLAGSTNLPVTRRLLAFGVEWLLVQQLDAR